MSLRLAISGSLRASPFIICGRSPCEKDWESASNVSRSRKSSASEPLRFHLVANNGPAAAEQHNFREECLIDAPESRGRL